MVSVWLLIECINPQRCHLPYYALISSLHWPIYQTPTMFQSVQASKNLEISKMQYLRCEAYGLVKLVNHIHWLILSPVNPAVFHSVPQIKSRILSSFTSSCRCRLSSNRAADPSESTPNLSHPPSLSPFLPL